MAFSVPTVTVDDLREFHTKHFPTAPVPQQYLSNVQDQTEYSEDYYESEDDALGYYDDGVKRTLTDEQIAIFRHSEIQAILRKRRLKHENGQSSDSDEIFSQSLADAEALVLDSADSPNSQPGTGPQRSGMPRNDLVEKVVKHQWTKSSPRTKAKNKKNRKKYQAKKREELKARNEARRNAARNDQGARDGDESDEWDPWHQATGPDTQKEDAIDLEY